MLGMVIAAGDGVGIGLLVAIFVSNLPGGDRRPRPRCARAGTAAPTIRRLWIAVAVVCALATVAGYGDRRQRRRATCTRRCDGFAAGALLVMLDRLDDPRGGQEGRATSPGLVTVLGFAVAAALSGLS